MKKVNRILAFLLVLAMVIPGFAFAEDVSSALGTKTNVLTEAIEKFKHDEETDRLKLDIEPEEFYEDEDEVRIIVELKSDPSVVQATERNLRYEQMPESSIKGIERKINEEQVQVKRQIESVASMKYINSFNTAFNGFSGMVKFKDIKAIEDIPKVNKVYIANEYKRPEIEPDMETSKDMVGTLPTWDIGYKGEGTVVAIIDTGIDPSHRDMVLSDDTTPKILRETLECKNLLGGYYTEKVPYGYNYYDLNNEILDLAPNASMHGMHVAGTVGANGDEENGGIKGVAPECQLLAMKVFSNDPIYATTFSDIYMEAIDEAIKLGADVLNMSLGSTAAFYIPDSAEDVSITNAVNNGIVCSVSAGNSGSMTYGWTNTNSGYPLKENPDIGVVGSPGLNKDTLQVAAIENTHQKSNALVYTKDGEEHKIAMAIAGNISPMEVFSGPQEFVDGGSGHPSELTGVAGKVALVVRGGLTSNFVDKIANAQAAGAIGVIVRNHETGGEALVNMATPDVQTIPAVFIGYTSGMELLGLENKEVLFSDELVSVANPDAWLMADFTSWGVTPSLELKPEITAPGVQIYSTLNGDKYGTMSGTSMAAPHVSGGAALVKEYIQRNKAYQNMSLSEQTRLAKVLMMNTAIPVNDEYETEYSPRRQGAGIMNLYGAVTTPVRLVDEKTNEAKVELKDFESTQFTMKFKAINDSASDETYNVDVKVMTDYIHPLGINLLSSDYIYDAQIDKPDLITVPANGETTFDVTVNIGADDTIYRNMFVEGFVVLTDPDDENPDISVPYVGFYGEWDEPAIVDGMMFIDHEGSSYFGLSGMTYWDEEGEGYYYTEPHIFMNPGTPAGTKLGTGNIVPYLSFMRNAETVKYNILDSEENNLRTILMEQYRVKNYFNGGNNNPVSMIIRAKWDGKINGAVVPDGDYFYEIAANIHYDGAAVQSKKIPITIDTVGPAISNLAYNATTNKLTWDSEDKGAGILGFMFNINGEEIEKVVDGEAGKTSYELDMNSYVEEAGEYNVVVTSVDKIYNMASGEITFNVERAYPYIYIMEPGLLEIYDYSEVLFEGYVTNFPMLDKVLINNIEADIEYFDSVNLYSPDEPSKLIYSGPAFKFTKILNLADGYQEAKIEAISSKGKGSNLVRRFYVDTTDPELSVDVLNINKELKTAELEISMKDNLGYLELFIGDSQIYVYEYPLVIQQPANQVMNYTVNLKEGENTFEFTLVDGSGHSTIQTASIELNSDEEPKEPSITNLEPSSDVELEPGGALTISFNAPAGGLAYYRILLPLGMQKSSYGTSMDEQAPGLYTAVWVAPEKLTASNLAIEVVYVAKDGSEIHEIAEGKISVMGAINDIPVNTIIIGDEAFDMDFINTNADAQKKVVEWFNHGGELFVKINCTTIVDADGSMVDIDELPDLIAYYDMDGNIIYYEK